LEVQNIIMSHLKITLPRLILAAMALVLVLGAIPAQAAKPNLAPAISLGPLSHREELRATINAKAKLTRIELRIDTTKVQPWVKAHAGWTYTIRYPLTKLAVGMHSARLQVWDQKNRSSQRQWQFQKLAQLALSADTSSIQPGEKVTLTGQGFTPGTAITVGMGGQNTGVGGNYGSAVADRSGAFTVEVTPDKFPDGSPLHAGTITLVAHNRDGSEKASAELRILPAPKITLDKSSIKPGDEVRVTGEGFTPGAAISISLGAPNTGADGTYGSAVADNSGRFSLAVTLARYPDGSPLKPGTVVLLAHTADFADKASAQLQVQANPSLAASKTVVRVGEWVVLSGEGFTPGKVVTISLGGVNTGASGNYGTTIVDPSGRFSLAVTLERYPNGLPLQAGPIVLVAHNPSWTEQASAQLRVVDRAPSAPSDLRITSLTKGGTSTEPTMVGLQWRDNASNETGFRIQATYTRMDGGTDTQVWNVAANATTAQVRFVAGGINPVSKACFTITAFNSQGGSAPSNEVCAVL
jgi:hypothetical protein